MRNNNKEKYCFCMGKVFNCLLLKERRRMLRKNQTRAEKILWEKLRRKNFGCRFLRQFGIGFYIADFYCPHFKLVIEVDGGYHLKKEAQEYDAERTRIIKEFGISVLRFSNDQIMNDIEFVSYEIEKKYRGDKELLFGQRGGVFFPFKKGELERVRLMKYYKTIK